MIKVTDLYKSYKEKEVLKGFSCTFEDDRIYCIMGRSGAGKSTLLKLILGTEKSDKGSLVTPEIISCVFQENRLLESFDSVRNIYAATGADEKIIREQLLEVLGEEDIVKKVKELSGGQKRRVAIVRAMVCNCDAVVMDEPFTGLDEKTKENVIKYILNNRKGRTLIVVTHSEEECRTLGGEIITID